jgi:hypothetical protein
VNTYVKNAVRGLVIGATLAGTAFAGITLRPLGEPGDQAAQLTGQLPTQNLSSGLSASDPLADGEALVGAAKISLKPRPAEFGGVWETNKAKCLPGVPNSFDPMSNLTHVADWRSPWIENSNCIYMGGYGIGPSNPITSWDEQYGLWVRSTVVTDAQGDTLVLTLLDAEGYFGNYNKMCGPAHPRCGAFPIAEDLGAELGISPNGFIIASTHSHTALDLIGGWGGVPGWYMDQITVSIKDSIRQAWEAREPARIEAGESLARQFNGERRTNYHSAQDPTVNWFRALDRDGNAITTVATYATHPVNYDEELGIGHADWPVSAAVQAEANNTDVDSDGGVASFFQAGLGQMTGGGSWEPKGKGIANTIPARGQGTFIANPDVRVAREFWNQPVTNGPLGGLGGGGFFDKPFGGPATVEVAKRNSNKPCRSASPVSATVAVVAAKIGDMVVTSAPGETFANYSNTIEERSPITALAIGQANDALGYMPQSFESDHTARQGLGFAGADFFEYEDAYSIDACFGDMALETTLRLLSTL